MWYNPATWSPVDAVQNALGGASSKLNAGLNGVASNASTGLAKDYFANQALSTPSTSFGAATHFDTIQKNDSPATDQSGAASGASGVYGAGYNPQALSAYDQALAQAEAQMGRLGIQEQNALATLLGQYNQGLSTLNTQKARTEADYTQNKDTTTQDNIKANSNIDFQTGRQANSLQQLLGSRGAGSSSAARIAAPYAAALQGTQQRNQVKDAFTQNLNALDTSYNRYNEDWNNSRTNLEGQLQDNQNQVRSGVLEKRSGLLQTLAQLRAQRELAATGSQSASVAAAQPYLDQVTALGGQIDQLGVPRNISVQNPTYAAPDLAKYNYDAASTPTLNQNTSAMTDTVSPYLSLLLKGKKQAAF